MCSDLRAKGNLKNKMNQTFTEQFVKNNSSEKCHTSGVETIQVTHGITFHFALPKRRKLTLRHIDHRELGMVGCFLVDPRSIMGRQVRITHQAANVSFHMEIIAQEIHRLVARRPVNVGKVHIWPCNDSTKHHPWWDTIVFRMLNRVQSQRIFRIGSFAECSIVCSVQSPCVMTKTKRAMRHCSQTCLRSARLISLEE